MARIFDWLDFVERNGIEHIDRGPNVGRGEINIKCPFCGTADPSFHMGLSLSTGWWACWRNRHGHSGKSPLRLLVKLLNIPYWKARQLAGLDVTYVDPEGFDALAARLMRREQLERPEQVQRRTLALPKCFKLIERWGLTRRHYAYLQDVRGFEQHTQVAINKYLLLADPHGDDGQQDRVIFPYVMEDELVTWTGRAIYNASIRYKDLQVVDSIVPPKETLYNHDVVISGGRVLCVVEGPMDTVKLDFAGAPWGVRAVGLSTNSMSEEQVWILEEAAGQFDQLVFIMDNKKSGFGAVDSMRIKQQVGHIPNARIVALPGRFKDCGEMPVEDAEQFSQQLAQEINDGA